jgi:Bacterial capsule synthesis protein PGA_cap
VRLALAGDAVLGRGVAQELVKRPPRSLVAAEIAELMRTADLCVVNLECCISERGEPVQKAFNFRAPPQAVETLVHLGVDCVTLANNHALDYGIEALLDTFAHLRQAGIRWAGAGENIDQGRAPVVLEGLPIVAFCDHEAGFAAGPDRPGIAYADIRGGPPDWLLESAPGALVCPHWGPNMTPAPLPYVRAAARRLCDAGPALVAGTSAHVFHGVEGRVLYDLGDFIDDYAVDPRLRNDHGLLFLVELEPDGPRRVEAVPIRLEYAHTRLARGDEADWIQRRFRKACWALGTEAREENGHLVVTKHEDGRAAARATHGSRSAPPGPPLRLEPPPSESGGRGGSPNPRPGDDEIRPGGSVRSERLERKRIRREEDPEATSLYRLE